MRAVLLGLLFLLLLPSAHAAPIHEAAILGARLEAVLHQPLTGETVNESYEVNQDPTQALADGCHDRGSFRFDGAAMRFEEQREQTGCGEGRITVRLPQVVDQITLHFTANREIYQASQSPALQLAVQAQQRLRVYDENGSLFLESQTYTDSHGHDPLDRQFSLDIPAKALGRNITFGWYFEDTGNTASTEVGAVTGRQFLARVRDVWLEVTSVPVPILDVATTATREEEETRFETVRGSVLVPEGWGDQATISIDHLDTVRFVSLRNEAGQTPRDLEVVSSGNLQHVRFTAEPGNHTITWEGTTDLPPPAPAAPPTRWNWLAPVAIAVTGTMIAIAAVHQVALRRAAVHQQRAMVIRMDLELTILVFAYLALGIYMLVQDRFDLATLPIRSASLILYLLLAGVFIVAAIHLGIGSLRRGYAKDYERAQHIEAANKTLAQSNRDLEQFAYVASHDLQEPLRKVATYTDLLRRYEDRVDAKGSTYIEGANDAALRARQLITDVLTYSRIGHDAPTGPVDLEAIFEEVLEELEPVIQETRGRVTSLGLPVVTGSESLLRQLLTNLVGNALKYRHPDRTPQVVVRARRQGPNWRIEVADNGIGIDAAHLDKVFGLFQRLHGRDVAGSGIGLAICQRIVEFHGGRIGVRSEGGAGSVFYADLPMEGPRG